MVKNLVVCYDQTVHAQKRQLIKRILDCAIGRMLEYKREIVRLDFTDYQWPDDLLIKMKFTPDDVEIRTPVTDKESMEQRRKYIQELLSNVHGLRQVVRERSLSEIHIENITELEESQPSARPVRKRRVKDEPSKVKMIEESPEEIVARQVRIAAEKEMEKSTLLVQSHERARMARSFAANAKRLYDYNRKLMMGEISVKKIERGTYAKAAITIQRAWRNYARKMALKKRIELIKDISGMSMPSWKCRDVWKIDRENFQRRLELIPVMTTRTEKATSEERTRLLRTRGPGLIEDITDEIREWFIAWYEELGHFDAYPSANLGGSTLIATGQTSTPQEFLADKLEKAKENQQRKKGMIASRDEKSADKSGKVAKNIDLGWKMTNTQALSCLAEANEDFMENWSYRDESENNQQKEHLDLIADKLCRELQLEMREIVDESMRVELEALNEALKKDYASDKKKVAIPGAKKGRKGKREKVGEVADKKRPRKGRKRDAWAEVPITDLFNELVRAKIIRNYPANSLGDWRGDVSYQNDEARREFREYEHRLGEIKQVVMEYCVLPLVSKEAHRVAPLTRSVCICGLPRSGKTFLANAICSEVGALLFDVTPRVLAGKYQGKKNEQRLIDIISKVSRVYAPSIIFIKGGEKPWLKSVPAEERYDQPKRFARYYAKLVKNIKPGDQILFLTVSSEPYKASRSFVKIHDKFIFIPVADYNTLYMYYKDLLMKYHGVDRNIDVSCLAKMSVGVPLEFVRQAVEHVLCLSRRITLKFKPLHPEEIMREIFLYEPPTAKTLSLLEKFKGQTPLDRDRTRMLVADKTAREQREAEKVKLEKT
ncbi:hypothetical protein KM043_012257 [Ampulex compressa]|nr:hypothetical protein KM043_012257 [Ampulex compressa]